ncbi:hypothetical protein PFISCL1PPCAC_1799, partial [Pristionchus fissidentatus]
AVAMRGGGQSGSYRDVDSTGELASAMKFCRKEQQNSTYDFNYSTFLAVHFVSDRSRTGDGFTMEYSLGCNSFDYIPSTAAGFKDFITSLNYPGNYPND